MIVQGMSGVGAVLSQRMSLDLWACVSVCVCVHVCVCARAHYSTNHSYSGAGPLFF